MMWFEHFIVCSAELGLGFVLLVDLALILMKLSLVPQHPSLRQKPLRERVSLGHRFFGIGPSANRKLVFPPRRTLPTSWPSYPAFFNAVAESSPIVYFLDQVSFCWR